VNHYDLVVIGAGLGGCSLLASLEKLGYQGRVALVEAGRGPGGRTASRRSRNDPQWCINHGAPAISLSQSLPSTVDGLLEPLRRAGTLKRVVNDEVAIDANGQVVAMDPALTSPGDWWTGSPVMASVCEGLLKQSSNKLESHFGTRVRWLKRTPEHWVLSDQSEGWQLQAKRLVLSGNLLAHPRSLAMLQWDDVPLRTAVPKGDDPELDAVLTTLEASASTVRWNLMLDLGDLASETPALPWQIWLNTDAQTRWGVERIVLHRQADARLGLVVHGLHNGATIDPSTQPVLLESEEKRLEVVLPKLLVHWPALCTALKSARSMGVMRWGAAQPLNHPVPSHLQWCRQSAVGFCGDWIEGPHFGTGEGAIRSGAALAERLTIDS
jgi:predicted NAD/FAD-dependent oxidoreductase